MQFLYFYFSLTIAFFSASWSPGKMHLSRRIMKPKLLETPFYLEVTKAGNKKKKDARVMVYTSRNLASANAYLQHTGRNNLLQQLPGVEVYWSSRDVPLYNNWDLVAEFPSVMKIVNYKYSCVFSRTDADASTFTPEGKSSFSSGADFGSLQPLHSPKKSRLLPVE